MSEARIEHHNGRPANPFIEAAVVNSELYGAASRLRARTSALHRAKVSGSDVAALLPRLLSDRVGADAVVGDVGCGRGSSTIQLSRQLRPRTLLALDRSAALLAEAAGRLRGEGLEATFLQADFHRMPLRDDSLDAVVAAFCLYHAPTPAIVLREIGRCLRPEGTGLFVTKSGDSYDELDEIIRPVLVNPTAELGSLYETFNSENAEAQLVDAFTVEHVVEERHRFRFAGVAHVAEYVVTSPKYDVPPSLRDPGALADALREIHGDLPQVEANSTVTSVIVRRTSGGDFCQEI